MNWLRRLLGGDDPAGAGPAAARERVTGRPPSGNGASSLHLFWSLPGEWAAAEVALEGFQPPWVLELYVWAVRANVSDGSRPSGGARRGLQGL
ncbi:MAG: hypothetical protein AB7W59_24470, partial [Acidimicrobiia bacterium]